MYEIGLAGWLQLGMYVRAQSDVVRTARLRYRHLLQHPSCQLNRNLPLLKSLGRVPAAVLTHYMSPVEMRVKCPVVPLRCEYNG